MRQLGRYGLGLLALASIALGFAGGVAAGLDPYAALVSAVPFIDFGAPSDAGNALTEAGRWLGFAFAAGFLCELVAALGGMLSRERRARSIVRRPDAVAIHGGGSLASRLDAALERPHVTSDAPASFDAPTQVVLFDDDARALQFMGEHASELDRAERVVVNLSRCALGHLDATNVHPINLRDQCAVAYWTDHPALPGERVAILGPGDMAERILTWGLLANITSPGEGVRYRMLGAHGPFRALHRMLDEAVALTADEVRFFEGGWTDHIDVVMDADRVVVCCEGAEGVNVAGELDALGTPAAIHLRADDARIPALMDLVAEGRAGRGERLVFGTLDELVSEQMVLDEHGLRSAKLCHLAYSVRQGACRSCPDNPRTGADDVRGGEIRCLSCPIFQTEWRALDAFKRESNRAVAAHDACKVRILGELGIDALALSPAGVADAYDALPARERDRLQEIEHIRWMRYHLLANWEYAPVRDDAARRHDCLVPYAELGERDRAKDADAWRTLGFRLR